MANERKHITQPVDWWKAFTQAAEKEGVSLSAWLGDAGKDRLSDKVVKRLSDRPAAHRPRAT